MKMCSRNDNLFGNLFHSSRDDRKMRAGDEWGLEAKKRCCGRVVARLPSSPQLRHVKLTQVASDSQLDLGSQNLILNMFAGISGNQPSQQGLYASCIIVILTKGKAFS